MIKWYFSVNHSILGTEISGNVLLINDYAKLGILYLDKVKHITVRTFNR